MVASCAYCARRCDTKQAAGSGLLLGRSFFERLRYLPCLIDDVGSRWIKGELVPALRRSERAVERWITEFHLQERHIDAVPLVRAPPFHATRPESLRIEVQVAAPVQPFGPGLVCGGNCLGRLRGPDA